MTDYEEDDVLIETEPEDSDFIEEHGDLIACVIQKVLYSQKFLTPCRDIKFFIQDFRSRIRSAILSLTMEAAKTSSLEHLWIT